MNSRTCENQSWSILGVLSWVLSTKLGCKIWEHLGLNNTCLIFSWIISDETIDSYTNGNVDLIQARILSNSNVHEIIGKSTLSVPI